GLDPDRKEGPADDLQERPRLEDQDRGLLPSHQQRLLRARRAPRPADGAGYRDSTPDRMAPPHRAGLPPLLRRDLLLSRLLHLLPAGDRPDAEGHSPVPPLPALAGNRPLDQQRPGGPGGVL